MREGGVRAEDLFARIRLRVNETTKGAQVPWNASKLVAPFYFFDRAIDAPPLSVSREQTSSLRSRPVRDFSAQEAYLAAVDRDTLEEYEAFLEAYPDDPMARRVRAIIAARREAITWRRTRNVNTPPAYWSYLRRRWIITSHAPTDANCSILPWQLTIAASLRRRLASSISQN